MKLRDMVSGSGDIVGRDENGGHADHGDWSLGLSMGARLRSCPGGSLSRRLCHANGTCRLSMELRAFSHVREGFFYKSHRD